MQVIASSGIDPQRNRQLNPLATGVQDDREQLDQMKVHAQGDLDLAQLADLNHPGGQLRQLKLGNLLGV